jgi:hypothetical protein
VLEEDNLIEDDPQRPAFDTSNMIVFTNAAGNKDQLQWRSFRTGIDWNQDGVISAGLNVPLNLDRADNNDLPESCFKQDQVDAEQEKDPPAPAVCTGNTLFVTPAGRIMSEDTCGQFQHLLSHNDWANLKFSFQTSGDEADRPVNQSEVPELSLEEARLFVENLNTTDLAIEKTAEPEPLEAGIEAEVTYGMKVTNQGPRLARAANVANTLPPGSSLVADIEGCREEAGTLTCNLGTLVNGGAHELEVALLLTPQCEASMPGAVVNAASVSNLPESFVTSGPSPDPDPDNNSVSFETTVVDTTAPDVTVTVARAQLWPPKHDLIDVGLATMVTDICDPNAGDSLVVEVWSDETEVPKEKRDGSGKFAPDAKFPDSSLRLRAERRGTEDGRVYLIIARATDASGQVGFACSTVTVSHDKSRRGLADVAAQAAAATAFCEMNGGAPPAAYTQHGLSQEIGPKQ